MACMPRAASFRDGPYANRLEKISSVQEGKAEPPPKVRLAAGGQLEEKPGMRTPDILSP